MVDVVDKPEKLLQQQLLFKQYLHFASTERSNSVEQKVKENVHMTFTKLLFQRVHQASVGLYIKIIGQTLKMQPKTSKKGRKQAAKAPSTQIKTFLKTESFLSIFYMWMSPKGTFPWDYPDQDK